MVNATDKLLCSEQIPEHVNKPNTEHSLGSRPRGKGAWLHTRDLCLSLRLCSVLESLWTLRGADKVAAVIQSGQVALREDALGNVF